MYKANTEHASSNDRALDARLAEKLEQVSSVRYIKLGRGGAWAADAIEHGIIPIGFRETDHALCAAGNWAAVGKQLEAAGRTPSGISHAIRELKDFYNLGEDCLWISFAHGHLYWAFAEENVSPVEPSSEDGPHKMRRTIGGWNRRSLAGGLLSIRSLSSALTRVASYRMTICNIERKDYALRRIRGEEEPLLLEARMLRTKLDQLALRMITQLDWRDFEVMVDLIFARSGWQRQSAVGDGEVDIDLLLNNPSTGDTAWVQIKSRATQAVLDDYLARFRRDGSCDHYFFVCHSASELRLPEDRSLHLWCGAQLARSALSAGLLDWLIERTR